MLLQESFQNKERSGMLYLVPTPIGNLDDITMRALKILKSADMIAAEDTRQTLKLCNHFEIQTSLVSYHEHNKTVSGEKILKALKEGANVALVSDAGTPAVSDPGYELVVSCVEEGVPVIPLPGSNAAVTSLIASGLPTDHFLFYGFLPRSKKEKEAALEEISQFPYTLIFYESPFRIKDTLAAAFKTLGNRKAAFARELTKRYETFVRGDLERLIEHLSNQDIKGECCLIIEGSKESADTETNEWWRELTIGEHVDHYVKVKALSSKEAIKKVAKERQQPKRDIYQAYHVDN
ncbi:16S rRNA (cytidine1402-2'-O)-methyltransferase [Scopulibacillus darangshiensis]|uniref:Ribosomal RNA small subunit methyltransferase I n=2 Tax=Scopulibacillus darangshiensis TaxID=442528 RepID=A0A4R2NLY8_9BACL|nr:16S rRNA (cytidine(1402)-2'-O)-methyltransferase [Scopulibacillus darangshiensis]TCP22561.1 16S rRNA (cytidine1402-2'-O)-methyltransferase [Scopulibacillus darangshiensis]